MADDVRGRDDDPDDLPDDLDGEVDPTAPDPTLAKWRALTERCR